MYFSYIKTFFFLLCIVSRFLTTYSYNFRKLIKKRSDISDTNKSRQVLLPGKSPKRKKVIYAQKCKCCVIYAIQYYSKNIDVLLSILF